MRFGAVAVALALVCGCGGSDAEQSAPGLEEAVPELAVPGALLDASWPVQMATTDAFKAYSSPGWVTLLSKRDYEQAAAQLGSEGGLAAARIHQEIAYVYRQAALLSAHALIETYAETPEETDPIGAAHLLTVSYAIVGELEKARASSKRLQSEGANDPTQAWHGPWRVWLEAKGGTDWPPDLSALPLVLPEPTVGLTPALTEVPHYALPERAGSEAKREMADPGALLALVAWHEAAAVAAEPSLTGAYRAAYRLPGEPAPKVQGDLPMEVLFGSDHLVSSDAAFLAAVYGAPGLAAVEDFKDKSVLAWLVDASRTDGKIDAERAVDLVAALRDQLVDHAKAQTDNTIQGHHRMFANIGRVGMLRSLALVAEKEGDRETSGRLRINAMELSSKATACPVGLMAMGAWDASNRYPTRAQEIVHTQARRFPSLEIARYGLDVMALRVSRERSGETPGM
jgi:hypothetical protein